MKTLTSRVFVLIVVGICAISAQAQTGTTMYANIPFGFTIGDTYLNSGEYSIKLLANNVESWRDANGKAIALFVTLSKETMGDIGRPRLVFRLADGSYRLVEVWSDNSAHEVLPGKQFKKMAAKGSVQTIALLKHAPAK